MFLTVFALAGEILQGVVFLALCKGQLACAFVLVRFLKFLFHRFLETFDFQRMSQFLLLNIFFFDKGLLKLLFKGFFIAGLTFLIEFLKMFNAFLLFLLLLEPNILVLGVYFHFAVAFVLFAHGMFTFGVTLADLAHQGLRRQIRVFCILLSHLGRVFFQLDAVLRALVFKVFDARFELFGVFLAF